MNSKSELVERLLFQMRAAGLPPPELEFRFHKPRRWRFDLCYPALKVAIEVEGAVFSNGRHTRGSGFIKDAEKYNTAALAGWRLIRIPGPWVMTAEGLTWIERAIRAAGGDA